MATFVKLIHNGNMKTVALCDGISSDEVLSLLKTVFNVTGNIVGIMAEKGLVIPFSLACKSPSIIPNTPCKLLVSNPQPEPIPSRAPASISVGGSSLQSDEAIANSEDSQLMTAEDESIQYVTKEIIKFLDSLRAQSFLTSIEHRRLHELLSENSSLLFAAYSVAVSANDSEYLAEICKELSTSLATEQGQLACEAQDETLQICDQLYIDEKITENQLLYLRHLTLIRDESVATIYDQFQDHQSVPLFAKSLYQLANTHPFQTSSGYGQDSKNARLVSTDDEEDDEDDLEEESYLPPPTRRRSISAIAQGLTGVVSLMTRAAVTSKTEANVLLEMIEQENDYVIAAYELYEKDKNLDDLQDTLIRCVKLEIRKRVTDIQEKELEALQQSRIQQENELEQLKQELEREDAENNYGEDDEDEDREEENTDDDEVDDGTDLLNGGDSLQEDSVDFNLEDISLESILSSLGINNIWKATVPEQFVKTIFIAVFRKQLSMEQAAALCDLFQAKYDIVHAAWEVFTVQGDTLDFIDTVKRIINSVVKDDENDDADEVDEVPVKESPKRTATAAATASPSKSSASSAGASAESPGSLNQRKTEALQAVNAAKRELLKHSLEMMVKQGLTSAEQAGDLYARYLNGDLLTDAAIETYASDRDVGEFLDTLQVLANNSKEDLDNLMKSVSEEDDNEQQSESNSAPSSGKNESVGSDKSDSSAPTASTAANQQSAVEDIAFMQIQDIVNEMYKNDMIGPGIKEAFGTLIAYRDQRLVKAFEQYLQTKSGAELVDSLLRIVIATVEDATNKAAAAAAAASSAPSSSSASSNIKTTSPQTSPKPTATQSTGSAPSQKQQQHQPQQQPASTSSPKQQSAAGVLDPTDQKTVIDILLRASAISREQHAVLTQRIDLHDVQLAKVFIAYEENKDVYALIDALRSLNLTTAPNMNTGAFAKSSSADSGREENEDEEDVGDDEDEEDDDEEEEEAEEENTPDVDEDDVTTVEEKFMDIIKSMELSDLETAALRLAIAENDPMVRLGIDRFRTDLNEQRLMETMRTAARGVITRTLTARMMSSSHKGEEDDDEDDEDYEDYDENDDESGNSREINISTRALVSEEEIEEENAADEADEEEEDEDNDEDDDDDEEDDEEDEEDPGSSLLLSQSARDHVFPILVQELVKESIISQLAGRVILREFSTANPVISTALDLYDLDNDMAQLVDTLQQLVENITTSTR